MAVSQAIFKCLSIYMLPNVPLQTYVILNIYPVTMKYPLQQDIFEIYSYVFL